MITILLVAVLLAAAGHFKGKMDAIADEGEKGRDWYKKYSTTEPERITSNGTTHWWYLGLYKPTFPEKFPFSSTILVFLTDRWHRAQFFMLKCFYLAISLCMSDSWTVILLSTLVLMPVIVGVFFEASYDEMRRKLHKADTEPTGDEPYDSEQVTSVPEKQIEDLD